MVRAIKTIFLAAIIAGSPTTHTDNLEPDFSFIPNQASTSHPAQMYYHSSRLLAAGEMNEAAFWFYAGQLRYRVHLVARPGLPPDQDPALFASLNSTLGQEINEYLGGDPEEWERVIERVLNWDAQTPNEFTPKEQFPAAHEDVRTGLQKVWGWIHENHDEIRKQRAESGLGNR